MSRLQTPTTSPTPGCVGTSWRNEDDLPSENARKRPHNDEEADKDAAPVLEIAGAELTPEELAAVAAVVGKLAAAGPEENSDAGSTGPRDRRLQRRRSLSFNRLGMWGRPGPDSWKNAGGLR